MGFGCTSSNIFECSTNGTSVCEYGPCTFGCCSLPSGQNDFCCSNSECTECGGSVIPSGSSVGGGAVPVTAVPVTGGGGVTSGGGPTGTPAAGAKF